MQHLAPAAENSKSVFFKGRPEARKWLRGEEGELFQLNGHMRKINPQPWKALGGGREEEEAESSKGGGEMSQTSTLERWDEGNP